MATRSTHSESIRHDVFQEDDPITFVDTGGDPKPAQCALIIWHGMPVATRVSSLKTTVLSVCEGEWFGATLGATMLQTLEPIFEFFDTHVQKEALPGRARAVALPLPSLRRLDRPHKTLIARLQLCDTRCTPTLMTPHLSQALARLHAACGRITRVRFQRRDIPSHQPPRSLRTQTAASTHSPTRRTCRARQACPP